MYHLTNTVKSPQSNIYHVTNPISKRDNEYKSDIYHVTNTISNYKQIEGSVEKDFVEDINESSPKMKFKFNEVEAS
jgi:hypothetical protein